MWVARVTGVVAVIEIPSLCTITVSVCDDADEGRVAWRVYRCGERGGYAR